MFIFIFPQFFNCTGSICNAEDSRTPEGRFVVWEEASKSSGTSKSEGTLGLPHRRNDMASSWLCPGKKMEESCSKEGFFPFYFCQCNSLMQDPAWKVDSCPAGQEIFLILWNVFSQEPSVRIVQSLMNRALLCPYWLRFSWFLQLVSSMFENWICSTFRWKRRDAPTEMDNTEISS